MRRERRMTTLNTNDFTFTCREESIRQTPLKKRDASKLWWSIAKQENFKIATFTLLSKCQSQVMPWLWMRIPAFCQLDFMVKKKRQGAIRNSCFWNTAGDEMGLTASQNKRLKVAPQHLRWWSTYAVTEELTHGGRIVRFEYEGIFLAWKSWRNAFASLYSRKFDDRERYQTVC